MNIKFSKKIVILSLICVIIFTILFLILSWFDKEVSETLIEYVYKFFGTELLALGGIRVGDNFSKASNSEGE